MKTAVLSLSGGVDSTTVLSWLLHTKYTKVHCVTFLYGSKHNCFEQAAAKNVFEYYNTQFPNRLVHTEIDVTGVFKGFNSDLLLSGGEIPEGHYNDRSMQRTVVPGRNIIFLSILAGLAWSEGAAEVAIGIHKGDHAIYADCRQNFHKAMDTAIFLGTDENVALLAPFVKQHKGEIVKAGLLYGVPYNLTRTCYKEQEKACGKCGSCIERLEAFSFAGMEDPIEYDR